MPFITFLSTPCMIKKETWSPCLKELWTSTKYFRYSRNDCGVVANTCFNILDEYCKAANRLPHHSWFLLNFSANLLTMPSNANRQFLDFEKPIKDLIDEIERLKHVAEQKKIDHSKTIEELESKILERRKEVTQNLSA